MTIVVAEQLSFLNTVDYVGSAVLELLHLLRCLIESLSNYDYLMCPFVVKTQGWWVGVRVLTGVMQARESLRSVLQITSDSKSEAA